MPGLRKRRGDQGQPIPVVGVGASAGGLEAFKRLFIAMPADSGLAFVLVQHLDPTHESLMVDLLSHHTSMQVVQVEDRMPIEANHVYVIPPARDLAVVNGELLLTSPEKPRGLRMPIDFFFRSLAEDQRERAICIILSGTGSDGTLGLKAIKSHGGMAMSQTPKQAQYDGMPVSAVSTGLVDYVLPVEEMPNVLVKYVNHPYVRGQLAGEEDSADQQGDLHSALAVMHAQLGYNFHHYKRNTLLRRIKRRMGLKQLEQMQRYVEYLRSNPEETQELFKDMLIGVTDFFREKESWDVLEAEVIPKLLKRKSSGDSIRVWVPGCSSGEEAYTVMMVLLEQVQKANKDIDIQLFASDIDTNALDTARMARYPASISADIPPHLLHRYFKAEDEFYLVSNQVRDGMVFSEQNLISDPPFSKMDLITCRNLLIYLQTGIQERVIEMFHFALREGGHLFLGNSETIGQSTDLFRAVSKKWRIFSRIDSAQPKRASFPILTDSRPLRQLHPSSELPGSEKPVRIGALVQDAVMGELAPASAIINMKHEVVYQINEISDYLRFPIGVPTLDIYQLAREGLVTRLRGAVHKALRDGERVDVAGARVKRDGKYVKVEFSVVPLSSYNGGDGMFLVSFRDAVVIPEPKVGADGDAGLDDNTVVKLLESELSETKEDLQNTIEELETSNEELKASNEEVMSMNEELQSSNEELETSKEELQSLNEELNTVNTELQDKVASLESTNNDLTNLMNSTNIASVFLDTQFHVKFFAPAAKDLFALISTDIGRHLGDINQRFNDSDLLDDAKKVIETLNPSRRRVESGSGEWYERTIQPYRTQDNRIEGLVITFENITRVLNEEMALNKSRGLMEALFNNSPLKMILLDEKFKITTLNPEAANFLSVRKRDVEGHCIGAVLDCKRAEDHVADADACRNICPGARTDCNIADLLLAARSGQSQRAITVAIAFAGKRNSPPEKNCQLTVLPVDSKKSAMVLYIEDC